MAKETGTKENPWKLKTPPDTAEYEMCCAAPYVLARITSISASNNH